MDTFQIITMSGVFVSSIAAVAAAVFSWIDSQKIQEVHLSLNSRLDALIANAEAFGRTEGAAKALADDKARRGEATKNP